MPRKGNRKGCEEDQVRDGETALREIWREWRIPAKDRSWRVVIENALETSEERKHREMTTGTTRGEEQLLVERDSQQGVSSVIDTVRVITHTDMIRALNLACWTGSPISTDLVRMYCTE